MEIPQPSNLDSGFNRLIKARYGYMLHNPKDRYVGKSFLNYGEFSEHEVSLFRNLLSPGAVILDIGAHIGAHTLFFAKMTTPGGVVLAFEPQRILFQTLCANMMLNGITNAFCYHAAVSDRQGAIFVPILDYDTENNFAGLELGNYSQGEKVTLVTIDEFEIEQCHFIKIDVEGMELLALKGAQQTIQRFRPILYVENDRKENSAALIDFIDGLDYQLYWHLPPLFNSDNFYQNTQNIFENIVSVNMICFHSSLNIDIKGFRKIKTPQDWYI